MSPRLAPTAWIAVLGLVLAVASPAAAQRSAPQAAPARSGLLLGVGGCAQYGCDELSTLWIVREGDGVRIAARGAGLLLPRRDGFWWVGVDQGSTSYDGESESGGSVPCDSTKADGAAAAPSDSSTDEVRSDELESTPAVLWTARAGLGDSARRHALSLYGGSRLHLTWVGSDWLAVNEESVDSRERTYVHDHLVRFAGFLDASPDSSWEFDPSGPALERAEEMCRRELDASRRDAADSADGESLDDPTWSSYWTVRRGATRWLVQQIQRGPYSDDDEPGGCPLPRGLAAPIVGHDRVGVPWSAIKEVLPGATTAFQSPTGDLLLVRQDSAWHAFLPRGRALGPVVSRFEIDGAPIMAQWAVGAHAARWTREVAALLEKGPPAAEPER